MTETIKMNPELKERWIQALRSGDFEQGASLLKAIRYDRTTYCCLGVLSELCEVPQQDLTWDGECLFVFPGNNSQASIEMPPTAWLESKGISHESSKILSDMNDGTGFYDGDRKSFSVIADWIENNL